MAKDWEYARRSKEMAAAGGPELWLNGIKDAEYNRGVSDTERKFPVLFVLGCIAMHVVDTYVGPKLKKWLSEKKEEKLLIEQRAIEAEKNIKKELVAVSEKLNGENTENDLEE